MARQSSADKVLADMTECSICTEVFTDPRVLPCIHTFCLNCLLNCGKDKRPGDRMPCPLCRKEFTIPHSGLSATQKDFKTEQLLHMRNLSAGQEQHEQTSDTTCELVVIDTRKVFELWKITGDVLERVEKEKNDVNEHLAAIENEINTSADRLIASVQRDRAKLLSEVESIKLKRIKQVETVKQEVEQHKAALEGFRSDSEALLSDGTACDVTRANSLHLRADELMKFDVIGLVDSSLPPVNVTFTSCTLLQRDDRNLVGTITEEGFDCCLSTVTHKGNAIHRRASEDSSSSSPTVIHVIPRGDPVAAVTSLDDYVFVVRWFSQRKIEVYDTGTFTLERYVPVPGLGDNCWGLAACPYNNCLYTSDSDSDIVHRVALSGGKDVKKWYTARWPAGLSVNNEHNVIVVSRNDLKLQIFTTHGTPLQNIQLQDDIQCPWHAVQLPSGQFLVSHGESFSFALHRVCLVGVDGAAVRSYGGRKGSELTQMNEPRGLAVDREGRVLVADQSNSRLLVIGESLSSAHEMSLSAVNVVLQYPQGLWYDQSRRRLYIGELHGGRLIVVGGLKDFTASI